MAFCYKCGANLPNDAAFCPKCGTSSNMEKHLTQEDSPSLKRNPVGAEAKKKYSAVIIALSTIVLVLVTVLIVQGIKVNRYPELYRTMQSDNSKPVSTGKGETAAPVNTKENNETGEAPLYSRAVYDPVIDELLSAVEDGFESGEFVYYSVSTAYADTNSDGQEDMIQQYEWQYQGTHSVLSYFDLWTWDSEGQLQCLDHGDWDDSMAKKYSLNSVEHRGEPSTASSSSSGPVLQDPALFFAGKLNYHEAPGRDEKYGGTYASFRCDYDHESILEEYVYCILDNYSAYTLRYSTEDDRGGYGYTFKYWYLSYDGSETVGIVSDDSNNYSGANVILGCILVEDKRYAYLWMRYGDGITFSDDHFVCMGEGAKDMGDHPYRPSGADSSSSYDSGFYSSGSGDDTCIFCNGKGWRECMTCGGDGYIDVWVDPTGYDGVSSGYWVHKPCSSFLCHGGRVDCNACGGDGKR